MGRLCHVRNMPQALHSVILDAMSAALGQYEETMGEPFPTMPKLEMPDDPEFWASVTIEGTECVIAASTGLIVTITDFWQRVFADNRAEDGIPGTADDLIHTSLVWLLLHELHHYQMGHFAFTGKFCLTEAKDPNSFGVVSRASNARPSVLEHIVDEDLPKVEPCLEMQADHDAIEMVLDAYSSNGWEIIRARTAAISAMMMLIEREDAKRGHDLSSHPKAATRIFQVLGHVIQMPMIEEMIARQHPDLGIGPHIPSEEEQSALNRKVVTPAFLDAVHLADLADAASIAQDLGTSQSFFQDIQIAHLADVDKFDGLATAGAQQWVELIEFNSELLQH